MTPAELAEVWHNDDDVERQLVVAVGLEVYVYFAYDQAGEIMLPRSIIENVVEQLQLRLNYDASEEECGELIKFAVVEEVRDGAGRVVPEVES